MKKDKTIEKSSSFKRVQSHEKKLALTNSRTNLSNRLRKTNTTWSWKLQKLNSWNRDLENEIVIVKQENLEIKPNHKSHNDKKLIAKVNSFVSQIENAETELNNLKSKIRKKERKHKRN